MPRYGNKALLRRDAGNRSVRAFLTGLGIDLLVGIALILTTYFADSNDWGDIEWKILGFSLFKSAAQAIGAYILRAFIDPSRIPSPLPPEDPGEPDAPVHRGEAGESVVGYLVIALLAVLILWVLVRLL